MLDSLTNEQRKEYYTRLETRQKDSDAYAALVWVGGTFGIHSFYLGKVGEGLFHMMSGVLGWLLLVVGISKSMHTVMYIGIALLVLDAFIWLKDVVFQAKHVEDYNRKVQEDIIKELTTTA